MNYKAISSAKEAKQEAIRRRDFDTGLNPAGGCAEFAYSPSTFAVGIRWEDTDTKFRVFNEYYPMHGRSEQVIDWISVGKAKSQRIRDDAH